MKAVFKSIFLPVLKNKVFFFNIILLIIIPSIINAYWINHEQYITISPIYKYGIKIRDGASFPYIIFVPFVFSFLLSTISMGLKCLSNKIEKLYRFFVYGLLLSLFIINVFLLLNFSTMLSPSIVMLIAETNASETTDFFRAYLTGYRSFISYMIVVLTIIYIVFTEKFFLPKVTNKKVALFLSLICFYMFQRSVSPICVFSNLFSCQNLTEAELWYLSYPVNTNTITNYVYSAFVTHLSEKEMGDAIQKTLSVKEKPETTKDTNIILVIGESFCKHHSNLYEKRGFTTNPKLQKEVDAGNLFLFNNVISPYNLTSFVIRNLFSVNSIMDHENWTDYPAFPILFKKAGYNVFFWDNQRTFGKADVSDFSIASYLFGSQIVKTSYTAYNQRVFPYDGQLIEDFFNHVKVHGEKNLIIFHLMGQHTMPDMRYPKGCGFDVFTKDSIQRSDLDDRRKKQIAHYENATLYNDWVVDEIIKKFVNYNAVVVYFSDHGEELYDFRDRYGRTQEKEKTSDMLKYQYEIPFMIWCSDGFKYRNPDVVKNIMLARDYPFMNDNVCQILMGLVGMKTKYYHSERNLISPFFKPYPHRIVQNNVNYEDIRFGKKK